MVHNRPKGKRHDKIFSSNFSQRLLQCTKISCFITSDATVTGHPAKADIFAQRLQQPKSTPDLQNEGVRGLMATEGLESTPRIREVGKMRPRKIMDARESRIQGSQLSSVNGSKRRETDHRDRSRRDHSKTNSLGPRVPYVKIGVQAEKSSQEMMITHKPSRLALRHT